jgi:hypothetical protein
VYVTKSIKTTTLDDHEVMNTIVLKPSTRQVGLPQYASILEHGIATGFAADPQRVKRMTYVIVLDNQNTPFIAQIVNVTRLPPLREGGKRRCQIEFKNPSQSEVISKILNARNIDWSSNNVRYIDLSKDELVQMNDLR